MNKHQNSWNLLVINPNTKFGVYMGGFYAGVWRLFLGVKDRQQAPPHLDLCSSRAKVEDKVNINIAIQDMG